MTLSDTPRATRAHAALTMLAHARTLLGDQLDRAVNASLGDATVERIERLRIRLGDGGVDPFGLDPDTARYVLVAAQRLYRDYFRAEVHGLANVPEGRVLLVSNHSGQIPLDGMSIACAMLLDHDPPRIVRTMVEKWTATLPFVSQLFPRLGQVVGVPENCLRLLEMEEAILVFPEGSRGISKPFSKRYKLQEFGLGFMRLALESGAPIVPVAVLGAEEQYISVANVRSLARVFGMPAFPVVPQLLLPGGFMPLPVRHRIHFGEPMHFTGDPDDEDAVIEEKVAAVRATVQSMINRALKERTSVFF
jgi:1-acyl-sn-glycerol-3-phosphate acyltransferase